MFENLLLGKAGRQSQLRKCEWEIAEQSQKNMTSGDTLRH